MRKYDDYGKPSLKGVSPVALGDGPKWAKGQPEESMFSIYSSSVAGVYGAIVNKTNVEGILKLDCNATDFYAENPFPVFMLYNPYPSSHKVSYSAQSNAKLYDMLMHQFITQQAIKDTMIEMKAGEVLLIAELPPDAKISVKDSRIMCDGKVVAWK